MAISRYENLPLLTHENGKRRVATFPTISAKELQTDSDVIIQLQETTRLDILAHQYLGDGRYWWAICMLNNMLFPFGNELEPGKLIRIPTDINIILNIINNKINKEF